MDSDLFSTLCSLRLTSVRVVDNFGILSVISEELIGLAEYWFLWEILTCGRVSTYLRDGVFVFEGLRREQMI